MFELIIVNFECVVKFMYKKDCVFVEEIILVEKDIDKVECRLCKNYICCLNEGKC